MIVRIDRGKWNHQQRTASRRSFFYPLYFDKQKRTRCFADREERRKQLNKGKRIIGIVLIAVSLAALISWEKWGKQALLYDDVLVCSRNISKGTILRENMFTTVKMELSEKDWLTPAEKDALIGKEAGAFIHKGVPLFQEYFAQTELSTGSAKGKYVLTVPGEWLFAVPEALRRGDRAYFFLGTKFLTDAPVSAVYTERRSLDIVVTRAQAQMLSEAVSGGEKFVLAYH